MPRINLIRGEREHQRRVPAPHAASLPLLVAPFLILALGLVANAGWYRHLRSQVRYRENRAAALERERQRLEPILERKRELEFTRVEYERRIDVNRGGSRGTAVPYSDSSRSLSWDYAAR